MLEQPLTIVQLSDPQLGFGVGFQEDRVALRQALERINDLEPRPDLVAVTGDLVDVPGEESYEAFLEDMNRLKLPWRCVPGNHDVGNSCDPEKCSTYKRFMGPDYFGLTLNGYRCQFINSQLLQRGPAAERAKMWRWLEKECREARDENVPIIMVQHVPLFVENPQEADEYFNIPRCRREQILEAYGSWGVVAVLSGHTHRSFTSHWNGMLFSSGETTSHSFEGASRGFRIVSFRHGLVRVRSQYLQV